MKKIMVFALFMVLVTAPVYAYQHDSWTTSDTVLQLTVVSLTVVDLMQTYTFLYKEPYVSEGHSEKNPFMGEHPSKKKLFMLGSGWIILHSIISYIIPYKPFRMFWQSVFIMDEIKSIHHNYRCGVIIKI